jgi:hypothetical protein
MGMGMGKGGDTSGFPPSPLPLVLPLVTPCPVLYFVLTLHVYSELFCFLCVSTRGASLPFLPTASASCTRTHLHCLPAHRRPEIPYSLFYSRILVFFGDPPLSLSDLSSRSPTLNSTQSLCYNYYPRHSKCAGDDDDVPSSQFCN